MSLKVTLRNIGNYLDKHINIVLIAPAMFLLLGIIIFPLIYNVVISVNNVSLYNVRNVSEWRFVGFQNFQTVILDPFVQKSFIRTMIFAFFTVFLQLILGLITALAFNIELFGKRILMPLVLAPMMITPVAVGLFWRIILNSKWGVLNYFLSLIGIEPQLWLADPKIALMTVVIVQVWWGVSFVFLVILGGLASLPTEPYEAAYIDGATQTQAFRYITLPLLKPVLLIVTMLRIIDALREFDIIYTLTGGGPGDATRVFTLELFKTAFESGNYGIAAAQAIILTIIIMLLTTKLIDGLSSN